MGISKLDVVNACIATMGQLPLDSVDSLYGHGAAALSKLNQNIEAVLARGWWFNIVPLALKYHAGTGMSVVPGDVITFTPADTRYQMIGGAVTDMMLGTTAIWADVQGEAIKRIDWDKIPVEAQMYISAVTVQDFLMDFDASSLRAQQATLKTTETLAALRSTDIKARRINFLTQGSGGLFSQYRRYGKPYRG